MILEEKKICKKTLGILYVDDGGVRRPRNKELGNWCWNRMEKALQIQKNIGQAFLPDFCRFFFSYFFHFTHHFLYLAVCTLLSVDKLNRLHYTSLELQTQYKFMYRWIYVQYQTKCECVLTNSAEFTSFINIYMYARIISIVPVVFVVALLLLLLLLFINTVHVYRDISSYSHVLFDWICCTTYQ